MPCIAKLYSSILNNRLTQYCDYLEIIVDEQIGFRKDRSCVDHIFVLTSIVRNRINNNLSTYCAFIDFKKAFDCINRELLLYKLLMYNIDGKMFRAINGLYKESRACIKINNIHTEFFNVESGVKQGDPLSPMLFNLFINDLASNINNEHCGVKAGIDNVSILLYADNIVLLSESSAKLQQLLNCLHK